MSAWQVSSVLLAVGLFCASACGSSAPTITCAESLADYCSQSLCVKHIELSASVGSSESSFCSQCGAACSKQEYAFQDCADGALEVSTQLGTATESSGIDIVTYLYDANTLDLTAVLHSTKASLTCLGGQETLSSHGACAPSSPQFQCP
jgi:hypothetical protein